MIQIRVFSYNNTAPAVEACARFNALGGTIGRSNENHLVLDDPKHVVSRTQAWVQSDGGRHKIVNLSRANSLLLNGRALELDREYELRSGDEIQTGLFLLRAEACAEAGLDIFVHTQREDTACAPSPAPAAGYSSIDSAVAQFDQGQADSAIVIAEPATTAPDSRALMQAFLIGAGIPDVAISQSLTPEFMEMLGKLLVTSVKGAMELNSQRALVKREARADVTVVVIRKNNPLKFLQDAETVLTQMLRKKTPGFMTPVEAMQDVYEDLYAHQIGLSAGMRATVSDLMASMDPDAIEEKSTGKSYFDAVFPTQRKARLRDAYVEHYRRLCRKQKEKGDFQAVFGPEFLQAYEREVERVQDGMRHA